MDNASIQFPLKKRTSMKQTQITCGYTQLHLVEVRFCCLYFFFSLQYCILTYQFSSFQSLSHVPLFVTPWTAAHQASMSITNSRSLLRLMSIESVMPSDHLILCLLLFFLSLIFPSIRVFSKESVLHIRWPKYWSFSISPYNEYSGLISFRID